MKLCLGIVKFGMNYGICSPKQISFDDAIQILDYATHNGINTIDTASAYGTSEEVLGEFINKKTVNRNDLFIVSKFSPNLLDDVDANSYYTIIKNELYKSLNNIKTDYLDSYIMHSAKYAKNNEILESLYRLKKEGLIKHCGVSVYEVDEAFAALDSRYCDFMQVPYSIFDQRMGKSGVFNKTDIIIHSRSTFIQGLILMDENQIPQYLSDIKPYVKKFNELCKKYNVNKKVLAMSYVKRQSKISNIIFGVDDVEQLKDNISIFNQDIDNKIVDNISKEFVNIKDELVMPNKWKVNSQ